LNRSRQHSCAIHFIYCCGALIKQCDIHSVSKSLNIPKGWYVSEAGQNPLFMLWFVVLVNFEDVTNKIDNPRHFVAEEKDSYEDALRECISNVC
jgi:hypothetical protein